MIPFIIPLISFIFQSYPRLFNRFFGVDVWTRLIETKHVRDVGHIIPRKKIKNQFIIEGYFDYPPVFPFILSFIPTNTLKHLQGFIAPLFDVLQIVLIYYAVMYLDGDVRMALLAQALYATTPMIVIENSYLTPRSLGYTNFTFATLNLLIFLYIGNPLFLLIGIIASTLIFLTHRFATQSFLFISVFFTYYLNTPLFIQVFLIGFTLAIVFTKGYYLRVLQGHLYNIYFWIKNLDYRWAHQIRGMEKKDVKLDWVAKINNFISFLSPIALFGLNPYALSGFILMTASHIGFIQVSELFLTFAVWIIFFYILGAIVLKTKYLMPIGEGQRYMEMATVPSSILSAYLIIQLLETTYRSEVIILTGLLIIANIAITVTIQLRGIIKDRNRSMTDDMKKALEYIRKNKKKMRIICIPHQNTTMTVYNTNKEVLVNADNRGLMQVMDVYPILRLSMKKLKTKYQLTHMLINTSYVSLSELKIRKSMIEFSSGDVVFVSL